MKNESELTHRVAELEKKQRLMQRAMLAAIVGWGLVVTLGQASPQQHPKSIKAQQFVVVDAQGRTRATLGMSAGGPELVLTNSRGRGLLQLRVPKIPEKAAIYMHDPKSQSGLELAMTTNGPVLHFSDKQGTRLRLATNELNAPLAAVYDAQGKLLFKVSSK